tara:strand:- start:317 stop:652 length:336 start_codon:yes stop_codon:yes gene_type:complete
MATITSGGKGRTDVSSRSQPDLRASDGLYNKITNFSGSKGGVNDALDFTGSVQPVRAFIPVSAHGVTGGDTKLIAKEGGETRAAHLTGSFTGPIEIGLKRISGSGTAILLH